MEDDDITDMIIDSRDVGTELTADKMFRRLGYMIDEDENRAIFDNREINIIFDKETRTMNTDEPITFNMQELKAINEKVKELGWI